MYTFTSLSVPEIQMVSQNRGVGEEVAPEMKEMEVDEVTITETSNQTEIEVLTTETGDKNETKKLASILHIQLTMV